ncbi:MAG TPA: MFS transporter [Thermoanaerobaculia bacterium]|nr:MFS transporter [Thermoanaerobaculia bacterium]
MRRLLAAYRDGYSGLPRGAWVLAAACFLNRSGTMVLPFLAIYLTSRHGFTPQRAGVVVTLYGLGSGVGTYWGGRLTDRFGPKRVQVVSLTCNGVGFLMLGRLTSPPAIALAVFLVGATAEAFRPANAAAFAAHAPRERWTQAFTLRRLALNLGMTCGPTLGGFLAAHDYGLLFVVDGGTCLAAAAVIALLDRPPALAPLATGEPGGSSPWRDRPFLAMLACSTLYAAVLYQFFSTYPLTLHEVHRFREPQIGGVYAINTVLIVVCEMLLVRRLSAASPLRVASWGMLLFCGGFGLLPFGRGYGFVAATVVVWTAGEMLTMPFLETVAAARGDARSRGSYLGAYSFAFSIAFASAPLLGTALYQRLGARPLFAGYAAVGVVLWVALRALAPRLRQAPLPAAFAATVATEVVPPT